MSHIHWIFPTTTFTYLFPNNFNYFFMNAYYRQEYGRTMLSLFQGYTTTFNPVGTLNRTQTLTEFRKLT